jgi:UDP-N-acetylmuramoyl-tripeptide--D-alanyl-D-alanine ligase
MKKIISNLILRYFRFFARLQLKKNPQAIIIGITGSAGKTSTRLALVKILRTHGIVKHSSHANSESGIPLNILGLRPSSYSFFDWLRLITLAPIKLLTNQEKFKYYVVEMGIDSPDSPKNMGFLLSIVRPHVAVILNAGLAHAKNFDHLIKDTSPLKREEKLVNVIAKEKMQLAKGISSTGVTVINIDQKQFVKEKRDVVARVLTFGKSDKADLCILPNFRFKYQEITHKLVLPDKFPDSYMYNFAAAIAAAAAIGIPPTISIPSLSEYRAPAGRLRIFKGLFDSTILDSSYNASPTGMLESLKLLKSMSGTRKKIAVIGDMRELGLSGKNVHKELANWLMQYCDEAILFGDLTGQYTLPVLDSKKFPVHHFAQMADLTKYLRGIVRPKSHILVKGSQNNIFLERAVEAILTSKDDVPQLCRRGPYWDKIRAKNR